MILFDRTIDVNLKAPSLIFQEFIKYNVVVERYIEIKLISRLKIY